METTGRSEHERTVLGSSPQFLDIVAAWGHDTSGDDADLIGEHRSTQTVSRAAPASFNSWAIERTVMVAGDST
ncbi:hypothetical protein GCM10010178_85290 [Lentzea flava]|uniref:Uncharacterized protein n=1 Tax=Lentzea flava TaxID=103732 RepID=A0ABQ2VGC7_9PSEU|nr:hypothetical protein GCM10010178_85290 [Lentzea flava]